MVWTVDIEPLAGGAALVTSAPIRSGRATWALEGTGGAAEFEVVAPGDWPFGQRRIALRDGGGTLRWRGFLNRLMRSGPPSDVRYSASAHGLGWILSRMAVHGDQSWTTTVATTIAQGLITHANGQTDAITGFTLGTVTGTAPARTLHACDGDVISELLDELGNMDPGGFDWEISPSGAFNCWVGGRGVATGESIAPGEAIDFAVEGEASELATYVTGLGGERDAPCGPPLVVDSTALKSTYGRREVVVSADTQDEGELAEIVDDELRARGAARTRLSASWIEGDGPWSFGAVWLGDTVTAALGAEFGGNVTMRVIDVTISLEGLHEFVTMTFERL